jgi:conjugative transfer region protein TrbK
MSSYLTAQQILRLVAVLMVTLVAAIALIQSRRSEETAVLAPLGRREADTLVNELARCRVVTSNDAVALDACRRKWAENRQHFFASTGSRQLPDSPAAEVPAERAKSEERIPLAEIQQNRSR